jgi:hypothetical protein
VHKISAKKNREKEMSLRMSRKPRALSANDCNENEREVSRNSLPENGWHKPQRLPKKHAVESSENNAGDNKQSDHDIAVSDSSYCLSLSIFSSSPSLCAVSKLTTPFSGSDSDFEPKINDDDGHDDDDDDDDFDNENLLSEEENSKLISRVKQVLNVKSARKKKEMEALRRERFFLEKNKDIKWQKILETAVRTMQTKLNAANEKIAHLEAARNKSTINESPAAVGGNEPEKNDESFKDQIEVELTVTKEMLRNEEGNLETRKELHIKLTSIQTTSKQDAEQHQELKSFHVQSDKFTSVVPLLKEILVNTGK